MRPVRIEAKGFGTFRESTEIDLDGLDLVALVGPTGSGKSTIIDAMTFALYGAIARYDDDRLVAPAIHQLANEARVRLDFLIDHSTYTAVRVVRRTANGATTKEARLQRDGEVLVSGPRELTTAVEELLGLDFAQFTKTIVLPQGAFADFLHDSPAERQKLLRQLLDLGVYARMGQLARQRATSARHRAEFLQEQLAKASDVTKERLAELADRERLLKERVTQVEEAVTVVESARAALADHRASVEQLDRQVATLAAVQVPAKVVGLDERLSVAEASLRSAEAALQKARTSRDLAKTAVVEGPDRTTVEQLIAAHARRSELAGELETKRVETQKAEGQEADAERAEGAARSAYEQAQYRARQLRLASDAAGWAAILEVGEACPVCGQTVSRLPDHDTESELAAAVDAESAAGTALKTAVSAHRKAQRRHSDLAARCQAIVHQQEALDAQLVAAPPVEQLQADKARAETLMAALAAAEHAVTAADCDAEAARAELQARQREERSARRQYTAARDALSELQPPPPVDERLLDDWQALATWAAAQYELRAAERQEATLRGGKLELKVEERTTELRGLFDPLGIEGGEALAPSAMVPALKEEVGKVSAEAGAVRRQLGQMDEWRTQEAAALEEASVTTELGRLLRAEGFEQWLLAEALDELVERATDRLRELSDGRYSLVADDNHFRIRDHRNAEELRDVRTLSGGETFLASLSLALALSERIADLSAQSSVRLDSVFLDEGFGTLDPETLDVVASALEELGATGRMVGIVTHIRDLADRMPARLEVRKGPTTSTVERVER
jgi:exonuclease SbcC